MDRSREPSRWTLVAFMLLASLLLHLILWPVGDELIGLGWDTPPLPRSDGWMQVALVDKEAEEDPPAAEDPARRRETDPPGRLIKQDRVAKEKAPDDAKYVSEFDQSVERETRAPNQRPRPGGLPQQPGDAPDANNTPRTRDAPQVAPPASVPTRSPEDAGEGDGRSAPSADQAAEGPLPLPPGARAPSGVPGLRGSPGAMERALGGPGTLDTIDDDVQKGGENLLNSRRWKYASFFNRVRDEVAEHWHPERAHASRDPTGEKFGTIPRLTRLFIKLNPDGSLSKISLETSSGLDFLDEEAIRAVRAAQPFYNPPPELIDPDSGLIEFGFGFRLEFEKDGGPIFRLLQPQRR